MYYIPIYLFDFYLLRKLLCIHSFTPQNIETKKKCSINKLNAEICFFWIMKYILPRGQKLSNTLNYCLRLRQGLDGLTDTMGNFKQ